MVFIFFNELIDFFRKQIAKFILRFERPFDVIINFIYSKNGYYAVKSGMFVDHFLKSMFNYFNKELNIFIGLFLLDKYLISRLIKKSLLKISIFNIYIINFKNKNQHALVIINVLFLYLFLLVLLNFIIF